MAPKYRLARTMRKSLTAPEFLMWERLKARGDDRPIFRRQYAIGPYILDFYCLRARLAVEIDGGQHRQAEHLQKDQVRDAWLKAQGIEVYRLPAFVVLANADAAADGVILLALERLARR
jgi:very-short-patch-repair endonuclease